MNAFSPAPSILDVAGCDTDRVTDVVRQALHGADDGELFLGAVGKRDAGVSTTAG